MEHGDVEDGRARYEGEEKIQEMGRRFGKKKKKKIQYNCERASGEWRVVEGVEGRSGSLRSVVPDL